MYTISTKKIFLLIKLLVFFLCVDKIYCCSDDCSQQAGVPCDIISGPEACLKNGTINDDFPDTLFTFDVSPVVFGDGGVGLDVSWENNNLEDGKLQGYQLHYWSYVEGNNPNKGTLDQCALYTFTSENRPGNGTSFNHTCVLSPTRVIQISSQPQNNPDTDYVHRVTVGYAQDYGIGNPARWQPSLVVIHNDSCSSQVEVQLYLAPKVFDFAHYRISLVNENESNNPEDKDIYVTPGDESKTTTFSNVKEGFYYLYIVAEPNDKGVKCKCYVDFCDFEHCILSTTNTFLMKDDHPKCHKSTTVSDTTIQSTTETQTAPDVTEIILYVILPVAVLAVVAFGILYFYKNKSLCSRLFYKLCGHPKDEDDDVSHYTDPDRDKPLKSVSIYDNNHYQEDDFQIDDHETNPDKYPTISIRHISPDDASIKAPSEFKSLNLSDFVPKINDDASKVLKALQETPNNDSGFEISGITNTQSVELTPEQLTLADNSKIGVEV